MPGRRNPLRRGTDRAEAWLNVALAAVLLLAGPWLAWWTADTTYAVEARGTAWKHQHHRPVPAVLTRDAPGPRTGPDGDDVPPAPRSVAAPARWTGPDGTPRTGTVPAAPHAPAGTVVTVWVDGHGTVVAPPGPRSPGVDAALAAVLTVAGLAALLSGVHRVAVRRLDRRRLRSWEAEWLIVGPRWTRH